MKKLLLYACIFFLYGCKSEPELVSATKMSFGFHELTVKSPAIKKNRIEESHLRKLNIFLPPSYESSQKKYPVIYYLAAYSNDSFTLFAMQNVLNKFCKDNPDKEFIMVGLNGLNKYQGSFYVNSPLTGNWEDYVIKEIIPLIEKNYRAKTERKNRAICGFSMGASGSINLSMKYPNLFSVVYAHGPGLFDQNGLRDAIKSWRPSIYEAYGSAFAASEDKDKYFDKPVFDNTPEDNKIVAKWKQGFGNLPAKVTAYLKKRDKLKAIRIVYGDSDYYPWIPKGAVYFSKLLNENKIKHDLIKFAGGHFINADHFSKLLLPFITDNLAY